VCAALLDCWTVRLPNGSLKFIYASELVTVLENDLSMMSRWVRTRHVAWPSSSKLDRGGWDWEEDEEKRKSEVEHLAKPLFTTD